MQRRHSLPSTGNATTHRGMFRENSGDRGRDHGSLRAGLFARVHLVCQQGFEDVNKRVSRLTANIPLFHGNLCPLSFVDVPDRAYIDGVLAIYELNRVEVVRDMFVWAYERSCGRHSAIRQSSGKPDPLHLRYRALVAELVAEVVRGNGQEGCDCPGSATCGGAGLTGGPGTLRRNREDRDHEPPRRQHRALPPAADRIPGVATRLALTGFEEDRERGLVDYVTPTCNVFEVTEERAFRSDRCKFQEVRPERLRLSCSTAPYPSSFSISDPTLSNRTSPKGFPSNMTPVDGTPVGRVSAGTSIRFPILVFRSASRFSAT